MQITSISGDDIRLRLNAASAVPNKCKFKIKEIRTDNKEPLEDITIAIKRNKSYVSSQIDIDEDHEDDYHLVLCDAKNTDNIIPNTNELKFVLLRDENEYPPKNINYKPKPIDTSTIMKVKDESNNKVFVYWTIPPQSFGDITYKIIESNQQSSMIDTLPYELPLSAIPTSFQVITIATIEDDDEDREYQYESDPSQSIHIGSTKDQMMKPEPPKIAS